jgi:hypothetical protein
VYVFHNLRALKRVRLADEEKLQRLDKDAEALMERLVEEESESESESESEFEVQADEELNSD